jgi:hypothetical protein
MDLLILVMKIKSSLNEKMTQEYRDAEDRAKEIKSSPVYKALE